MGNFFACFQLYLKQMKEYNKKNYCFEKLTSQANDPRLFPANLIFDQFLHFF